MNFKFGNQPNSLKATYSPPPLEILGSHWTVRCHIAAQSTSELGAKKNVFTWRRQNPQRHESGGCLAGAVPKPLYPNYPDFRVPITLNLEDTTHRVRWPPGNGTEWGLGVAGAWSWNAACAVCKGRLWRTRLSLKLTEFVMVRALDWESFLPWLDSATILEVCSGLFRKERKFSKSFLSPEEEEVWYRDPRAVLSCYQLNFHQVGGPSESIPANLRKIKP